MMAGHIDLLRICSMDSTEKAFSISFWRFASILAREVSKASFAKSAVWKEIPKITICLVASLYEVPKK
jgi:hypothetical protein